MFDKMKINKLIYGALFASLMCATSCDDWMDINHDPDNPEAVDPSSMLAGIEVGSAYNLMSWDYALVGGVWINYFTQMGTASQFKDTERYNTEYFANTWSNFYTRQLMEAKTMCNSVEDNSGYKMIGELIQVFDFQYIVDTWGDVPYTEALNDQIPSPKFDKAQDIYADLLKRVNAVIDNYEKGVYTQAVEASNDFVFEGDLSMWFKFARSLKLKLMLRLSETYSYSNSEVLDFIKQGNLLEDKGAVISGSIFGSQSTKFHPLAEIENGKMISVNINASRSIVAYMSNDPRLEKVFTKLSDQKIHGRPQGNFNYTGDDDNNGTNDHDQEFSKLIIDNNADLQLISVWQNYFNIAEVYARANDFVTAETYYEKAVLASLNYWGVESSSEAVIGADGYAQWKNIDDSEKAIELISLQRWAAFLMTQHSEAFIDYNRTKYPRVWTKTLSELNGNWNFETDFPTSGCLILSQVGESKLGGQLPASAMYPLDEVLNLNSNAPSQKADNSVKVFWNTRNKIVLQ